MRASTTTTLLLLSTLASFPLIFAGAGCSSDSATPADGSAGKTGTAGTGSAGTTGTGGTTGVAGTTGAGADAGTDAPRADAGDAAATDASDAGTAETGTDTAATDATLNICTNIALPAPVFAHYLTTAGAAPAGGTIVFGTYSLTELNHYGSATASTSNDPIRSAIKFTATTIEWANQAKTDPETRASYTYAKGATTLALTNVCPTASAGNAPGYTATATTFKLYLDAEYVYTLQQ